MQEKIETISDFLKAMMDLLRIIEQSSPILFRTGFRENYAKSLSDVLPRMEKLTDDSVKYPDKYHERMEESGLLGAQQVLKLESFASSFAEFRKEGGLENLEDALGKGGTLLSSLAAAIPGFGSFAQELVDFIIKELKKRFKFWKK
jgi:hypothetical protein